MNKSTLRNEIIRCGRDPAYFIRRYVRIQHPVRGLISFDMFDYQEELVADYQNERFNIILKARQLGISEITAAYALWLILFHREKNVLVMASKAETAKNIIRKVRTAFKKLPKWLALADSVGDNVLSLELTNGSRIKAIATASDAGRSEAVSLLIIDEAAFIERFDDLWTGLYPTVAAGGRAIVLSTPNGVGNKFHQLYVDAEAKENDFKANRLMWWLHPERIADLEEDQNRPGFMTSAWFRKEVKASNMGPREVAQELECNFNASGETVISAELLDHIKKGALQPMARENWDRNTFVWWKPQEGKRYMISADVARGDGRDYSAAHVWDVLNMEQVAEYYGKVPPDEFAKILCDLGKAYNNALLVIENNVVGMACLEHVRLAFYPNTYYSRKSDSRTGEAVNCSYGTYTDDLIAGFSTTPKTRPLMVAKLEEYVRNHTIVIRSDRFLHELQTFIWDNGKPQAMKGYNDDLVMAAAIGAWTRDTFLGPTLVTQEANIKMLQGMSRSETKNTDIHGACKDPTYVNQKQMGSFSQERNPMQIRLPNGQIADYSWLISKG